MRKLLVALGGLFLCLAANAQNGAIGSLTASSTDCSTAGSCITLQFDINDVASASIQLSGTFTATVQFEASSDKGTTWVAIAGTPLNSSTAVTSATTANTWKFNVASITNIRARASAWTSAPTVVIRSSRAVANAIGGGGAVFASGGTTNNVIPKSNGSSVLVDSLHTDTGTTDTYTGTGGLVSPAYSSNTANVASAGQVRLASADTIKFRNNANGADISLSKSGASGTGVAADLLDASGFGGVKVPAGANSTLSIEFGTFAGIYSPGANVLGILGTDSTDRVQLGSLGLWLRSNNTTGIGYSSTDSAGNFDTALRYGGAAQVWQFGLAANATPKAYTVQVGEASRSGTDTNTAGNNGILRPGAGTGTGAAVKFCVQRNLMGASGTTAQSQIDGYCVGPSKTLSNTSATAQSLVNISVPSNSAGGVFGTITVTCTDGTNFDAETQSFNTSFVNKATVLTVTAPVITATTAANNSGSCTAGITAVAGTNSVDIKVTPVFTTIVPTTVTSYIELANHGIGNVTFN